MKKRYNLLQIVCIIILIGAIIIASLLCFAYFYVKKNINYSTDEELFRRASMFESTVFYGRDYENDEYIPVKAEISGLLKKSYILLDEIPQILKDGFIAVEDRGFYEHSGVDYKRTAYAAFNYLFGNEKRFGASTITQQVIKNISGDNEVTISRKLSEILRAVHIEKNYSKDEILELYLNIVPMSGTVFGVSEAARLFFGKEVRDLNPAECATLIGITNAPTAYSPYRNSEKCLSKRNSVLEILFREGVIDSTSLDESVALPLNVAPENKYNNGIYSWFVEGVIDTVSNDLSKKYGISNSAARLMLLSGGYSVFTTMNIKAQEVLEEYFENNERFERAKTLDANYSMVVLDSNSADIIAVVGGAGKKQGNRLLDHSKIPHLPASTLKPIAIYAPMLDDGSINWATVVDDTPVTFKENNEELIPYPKNSPNVYDGLLTVKDALRLSKNTIAMKLCKKRGTEAVFEFLKNKMGIDTLVSREEKHGKILSDIGLAPLALGQLTKGISLQKMTECYSIFPTGGILNRSRNYLKVVDYEGNTILSSEKKSERIIKSESASIMNQLLSEVVNDGTAKGIKIKELIATAGKTGTSSGGKDRIFIGYTPYFTAGIWCGSESNSVLGLAPSPLSAWDDIMIRLHEELIGKGEPRVFDTGGLLYLPYCRDSGEIYSENCVYDPRGYRMEYGYFTKDNMPTTECKTHVMVFYDGTNKGVSLGKCPDSDLSRVSLIKNLERGFPTEIYITDAEFIYRDINQNEYTDGTLNLPYFYSTIPEGIFVGITNRKKQFNSSCPKHR